MKITNLQSLCRERKTNLSLSRAIAVWLEYGYEEQIIARFDWADGLCQYYTNNKYILSDQEKDFLNTNFRKQLRDRKNTK